MLKADFLSWLKGVLDMNEAGLNSDQIRIIQAKIDEVGPDLSKPPKVYVKPSVGGTDPVTGQKFRC